MIGLLVLIFLIVLVVKVALMLSLETIVAAIALLIVIPLMIGLFNLLDQITFKGYIKLSAIAVGLYGLSWCWQALPA